MRSFQTPLRMSVEEASAPQKMSFSDRQKLRKQNALKLEPSAPPPATSPDDTSAMTVPSFKGHSFSKSSGKPKESFSDRQKQRKTGELTIPEDVKPMLSTRMTAKVSFSERQRLKKQQRMREIEAVESIDGLSDYGASWIVFSAESSPADSPHASEDGGDLLANSERQGNLNLTEGVVAAGAPVAALSTTTVTTTATTAAATASKKMLQIRLGPSAKRLVSGAVAGGVSRTVVAPLETIRTHLMVGNTGKKSVGEVYNWIMETEGWKGLFRGNALNVLRVAPSKAIELFTYDTVKKALTPKDGSQPKLPIPISSIAGSSAGMASCAITYPLELVKTRLTVQPRDYNGVFHAFWKIVTQEGFGELYRGLTPSIVGVIPYAGTNYFAYDTLRTLYKKVTGKKKIEPIATLCIGSLAGAFAASATFPLEVARKQMQVGALKGRVVYKGTLDCLRSILKEQGVQGLYKGLGPSCIKLMPAAGISFMCYELLKKILIEENE